MLKAILAKRTQKAANPQIQAKLDEYCDEELPDNVTTQTLEKDRRYCLTKKVFFLIGSEGAKIAYIKDDGSLSKQTDNAIGATSPINYESCVVSTRTYQIIVPKTQTVRVVSFLYASCKGIGYDEEEKYSYEHETRFYISLKKNYEGKMSTFIKYSNSKLTIKDMHMDVINPNGATISTKNEESTLVKLDSEELKDPATIEFRRGIYAFPKDGSLEKPMVEGEWSAEAKITIKGNEGIKLPEKFFEITPDTIYTTSTPDASLTDSTKSSEDGLNEYCDEELLMRDIAQTLEKDKKYCLTVDVFFLVGSEGAKIAYINEDGSLSKQTNDAIGATSKAINGSLSSRTYQIVVPKRQTVRVYCHNDVVLKEVRYYALLKKNYEGKLSSYIKYSNSKLTAKYMFLSVMNPNNATIYAQYKDNTIIIYGEDPITPPDTIWHYNYIFAYPKEIYKTNPKIDGEWSAEAKITIKGNEGIKLPEKFFELTPDTIYTTSTPDASLTDSTNSSEDGLGAGAIVGIVLAIVIVLGFVGFSVYWWIFRDKASYKEFPEV